jgi:hypothetical protein
MIVRPMPGLQGELSNVLSTGRAQGEPGAIDMGGVETEALESAIALAESLKTVGEAGRAGLLLRDARLILRLRQARGPSVS